MRQNLTLADLPPMSQEEKEWWEEHNAEYYHYFYKITNNKSGKFYYGIHSQRIDSGKEPENDGYMGSGTDLKKAQNEEGIENFTKIVVKTFSTRDEARLEEMMIVDEDMINDPMCYNIALGGGCNGNTRGFVPVNYKDPRLQKKDFFMITCEEYQEHKEDYITRVSGFVSAKENISDKFTLIPKDEYQKNKDKYYSPGSGYVNVRNDSGDYSRITVEEYYKNKSNYTAVGCERVPYKNKDDWSDVRRLDPKDPLVLSGQFIGHQFGVVRSEKFKKSISGKNNGSYNSFWITDGITNKKMAKGLEIPEGWERGRTVESYVEYINLITGDTKFIKKGEALPNDDYVPKKFVRDGQVVSPSQISDVLDKFGGSVRKSHKELKMNRSTFLELIEIYENQGYMFKKK